MTIVKDGSAMLRMIINKVCFKIVGNPLRNTGTYIKFYNIYNITSTTIALTHQ